VRKVFEPVTTGLLVAIIWAAFGYALAKAKGENFDPTKFTKTLLIGIIMASIGEGLGIPLNEVEGMSVVGLLTIFVDKITGLLIKKQ
jgi:hypothetical protein